MMSTSSHCVGPRVCQMMTSLHIVLLVTFMSEVTSAINNKPTPSRDHIEQNKNIISKSESLPDKDGDRKAGDRKEAYELNTQFTTFSEKNTINSLKLSEEEDEYLGLQQSSEVKEGFRETEEIKVESVFYYHEEGGILPLSGKSSNSWMKFFSGGDDKMPKMFGDSDQTNSLLDLADGNLDMKALTDLSKGVMKGSDPGQVMTLRLVITEQEVYQFGVLQALLTAAFVTSVIFVAVQSICPSKSKGKYDQKYFTV